MNTYLKLFISIFICQLPGLGGSIFTRAAIPTWYAGLAKPVFTPPNWVFAPVWILLYVMMGISFFLVWQYGHGSKKEKIALFLFCLHLAVNFMWSAIFFGLHSVSGGMAVIVILLVMIAALIVLFRNISRMAALLLVPYLVWVCYATVLNTAILILN